MSAGNPMEILGRNIRAFRDGLEPKVSRAALAKKVGMDPNAIAALERGRYTDAYFMNVFKVLQGLGMSANAAVLGIDSEYDSKRRDHPRHGVVGTKGHMNEGGPHASETAPSRLLAENGRLRKHNAELKQRITHLERFIESFGSDARKIARRKN